MFFMERNTKIWIAIGIVLVLFIVGNILVKSSSYSLNNYLNKVVRGEPDKSCVVDSDCKIASTTCNICQCGSAVNINWEGSFCPFPELNLGDIACSMCLRGTPKCIKNICTEVYIPESCSNFSVSEYTSNSKLINKSYKEMSNFFMNKTNLESIDLTPTMYDIADYSSPIAKYDSQLNKFWVIQGPGFGRIEDTNFYGPFEGYPCVDYRGEQ